MYSTFLALRSPLLRSSVARIDAGYFLLASSLIIVALFIFKFAFSTFWFNPYDVKLSGAIAERGKSHVT